MNRGGEKRVCAGREKSPSFTKITKEMNQKHWRANNLSSGALIEVTLLFRYSTTDREATRVLALFGHLSEWQFN